jgi:hypothetical protein
VGREDFIDSLEQIAFHLKRELLRTCIGAHGRPGFPDPGAQSCDPLWSIAGGLILAFPQIKECPSSNCGIIQRTMHHFPFGQTGAGILDQPGKLLEDFVGELCRVWDPTISIADKPNEKRPAAFDFAKAGRHDTEACRFGFGDAPAEIHLHAFETSSAAGLA